MTPRVYVRKAYDSDAPFMYVELDDGRYVSLGGRGHGRIRDKTWCKEALAAVDEGNYDLWERIA